MIYLLTMHFNQKIMIKIYWICLMIMFSSMMQERRRTIKVLYPQDQLMSFIEDCFAGIMKHSRIIFLYLYEMLWFKHGLRKLFSFRNWIYYRNWKIELNHLKWKHIMNLLIIQFFLYVPREIDHFSLNTLTYYCNVSAMFISGSRAFKELKEANCAQLVFYDQFQETRTN